ncbi:hypothetical protein KC19_1G140900 [Ceratodon purpureus]|uniref:Uncharacterized protein n=1 Tax=Ceratodon purpureus TaxID=3225 RepID=A0A8T0J813_CERPU|nr:hypothetical protein KC19_1G140900 [Ceratodon purpureus]
MNPKTIARDGKYLMHAAGSGIVNVHHDLSTFPVMLTGRDGHSQRLMLTPSCRPEQPRRSVAASSSAISSGSCIQLEEVPNRRTNNLFLSLERYTLMYCSTQLIFFLVGLEHHCTYRSNMFCTF